MAKYKRNRQALNSELPCVLDVTDRSLPGHSFNFEKDRRLKDFLCIVRERIMSPLLKLKYPESASMSFGLIAKEWSMSLQRQRLFCSRILGGLKGKTVLVLGCGYGGDALAWVSLAPARIIAVDIVNYESCWQKAISLYSTEQTKLDFYQFDLVANDWDFLVPGSVDVIFSYAVLEHLSDLPLVIERAKNALKPEGLFVASYGPLWYGPHGDHTFPKSEDDCYNHLLLGDNEYQAYVERIIGEWAHSENGNDGTFLLERGYYSYLRPNEYLEAFASAGFEILLSIINISSIADRYFKKYPKRLIEFKEKFKLKTIDLYASGSTIILRKL